MSRRPDQSNSADFFLKKTIEILFYCLFFFTPLILWPYTSEVFEFNKMLFVYLLSISIGSLWAMRWLINKKIEFKRTPLDLPILLFLSSQVISTVFSLNPHTSFWGYYSRFHGGLASTFAYLLLYYALVSNLSEPDKNKSNTLLNSKIQNLVYAILGSTTLISIYAVLEHFGIDKTLWIQDVQSRVFSTLGQPNWLSAYLVAVLPISIYYCLNSKKSWPKLTYFFLSLLFFTAIIFTKSRSGIGATGVVLIFIFLERLYSQRQARTSLAPLLIFLVLSLVIGLASGTPWTPTISEFQNGLVKGGPLWPWGEPYLNKFHLTSALKPIDMKKLNPNELAILDARAKGIRYGGSNSGDIRDVVWQGAIELAKRRPFFGYGLETFGYTYYNVRPVAHNLLSEWDFLYNKAHNEYLNFLSNSGFVGLGTYLLLTFAILYYLIKAKLSSAAFPLRAALVFGFVSILITNYFGFSVVNIALFYFLFPAFIEVANQKDLTDVSFNLPLNNYFLGVILLLNTGYAFITPINQFRADLKFNRGKILLETQHLKDALTDLQAATNLNNSEPTFYAELAEAQATAVVAIKQQLDSMPATISAQYKDQGQQLMDGYLQGALNNSQKAVNLNPYHTVLYKSKAKVELYLGLLKPEYNKQALNTLLTLSTLAPTDAKVFYNLGLIYDQLGQRQEAQAAYQKALELKPDYEDAKRSLATKR